MAGFAKLELRLAHPCGWFDQLAPSLTRELAPQLAKIPHCLRLVTIATLGAGLVASCHGNSGLGTYAVWLLVGAGAMMSFRKAEDSPPANGPAAGLGLTQAGPRPVGRSTLGFRPLGGLGDTRPR